MPPPNGVPDGVAAKFQFRQAIIVAIITSVTTLIAAYWGTYANRHNPEQVKPESIAGLYSWQWVDNDGWPFFGWINVAEDGSAQLTLERWMMCESENKRKRVPVVETNSGARFTPSKNSSEITVDLPVQFIIYDKHCNRTGLDPQTIHGKISQAVGYRGRVDYISERRGHFPGNMELLKEIAGGH
jgi:hypothetical protein